MHQSDIAVNVRHIEGMRGNIQSLCQCSNKFRFRFSCSCSFYAFEMLYWCGIREGELLALTAADFNFEKETVRINKFYQRLHGEDVITTPKTKKSNRMIKMPKFLCEEMQEYLQMLYGLKKKDRIFTVTKNIVEVYI